MPTVPAGVIVMLADTMAIPTGWTRVTSLDGRFPKGAPTGVSPDATGGATTHAHASSAHNHGSLSHTHAGGATATEFTKTTAQGGGSALPSGHSHTHPTTGTNAIVTSSSDAATWQSATSLPSHYEMVFIRSNGTPAGIPNGACVFWNSATGATGWTQHVPSQGYHVRGAATGANPGTTAGSNTHSHNANAHTHTLTHNHTGTTSGAASYSGSVGSMTGGGPDVGGASDSHTHVVGYGSASPALSNETSSVTGTDSGEPAYRVLPLMKNTSGGDKYDDLGLVIAMWLGLISAIPAGWVLCDGTNGTPDMRDRYVKVATLMADFGTTGGSSGHSHTSPGGHTHSTVAHAHGVSLATNNAGSATAGGGTPTTVAGPGAHIHPQTGTLSTATDGSGVTSSSGVQDAVSTASTEPPFRTVAFIMLTAVLNVDITSPTDGSTVDQPAILITWAFGGAEVQQSYQLRVYTDALMANLVYDSGVVASSVQSHQMPDSGVFDNDTTYYLRLDAVDTDGVPGTAPLVSFTTSWVPPASVGGLQVRTVTEERETPW